MPWCRYSLFAVLVACTGAFWVSGCKKTTPPGPPAAATSKALSAADVAYDWTMFRGDPHQTGVARSALPERLVRLWSHQADAGVSSTAAVVDQTVYVGTDDGRLLALELETGKPRWTYTAREAVISGICVNEGRAFFGDGSGMFHAVDVKTGQKTWTFETQAEIRSSANVSDGAVLFASCDSTLYCLDAKTGRERWRVESGGPVYASPCIMTDTASTAGCDGVMQFIDLKTGEPRAEVSLGHNVASPAFHAGNLYAATVINGLHCVDVATAEVLWSFGTKDLGELHASPAAGPWGVIIATRDGKVIRLDDGGVEQWRFSATAGVASSPVVVGGRVFFGSDDGTLYAVGLDDGKRRWRVATGSSITASPAVARGRLVVGTEDGHVLCFGAK